MRPQAGKICQKCGLLMPLKAFPRYRCRAADGSVNVSTYGRRCYECFGRKRTWAGGKYDEAIMRLVPEKGVCWDQYELAKLIGCTRGYVSLIENAAMRKLVRNARLMRLSRWDVVG